MKKRISILGSTGSIGCNALNVLENLEDETTVVYLSCFSNSRRIIEQARRFRPDAICLIDKESYNEAKNYFEDDKIEVLFGREGLIELASRDNVDVMLNGLVGSIGMEPTLCAINSGIDVALSNKESLVMAGPIIIQAMKKSGAKIFPVDSEHSAIWQCLTGEDILDISKIMLTGSGGPFLGRDIKTFGEITLTEALNHPNWNMGKKITIDSATMMNKGLEIIEAKVLFNLDVKNINAIVHRQSKIHALVEFYDGTTIAHLSQPDMKIPISYALTYPERIYKSNGNVFEYEDLTFDIIPHDKFPCYKIARIVAQTGKNTGLILNAANEISVEYFLNDKIRFVDIPDIIQNVLDNADIKSHDNIESILDNDMEIRVITENIIKDKYGTIK